MQLGEKKKSETPGVHEIITRKLLRSIVTTQIANEPQNREVRTRVRSLAR